MKTLLIEPTDVLFFRDAVPMSAGQGKGAGARMPFPSTLHEAFRSSLLLAQNEASPAKGIPGRPRGAPRKGNWHGQSHETDVFIASKAFAALRTLGPFPFLAERFTWRENKNGQPTGLEVTYDGLLLPVPLDVAFDRGPAQKPDEPPRRLVRLKLWRDASARPDAATKPDDFRPLCLPVAVAPPDKHGQLHGWWTLDQFRAYLELQKAGKAREDNANHFFRPLPTDDLWQPEHRIGVQIDPANFASAQGQLYAGSYLRMHAHTRFAAQVDLGNGTNNRFYEKESQELESLSWLLLGGERRLARLWRDGFADPFPKLPPAPQPPVDGPCLLKWVLVTPAIFAHGSLPGWCWNERDGRPVGEVRLGASQRKPDRTALPGRARLISWCLGKPLTVSGWDVVEGLAKSTQLAVPVGSVYYFLCQNAPTARTLAQRLHWQPRSDFYGEKGCGYGLCSFAVAMHRASIQPAALAAEVFP
jgi:CRISPR type III-B/RAMP module-associated protein Cmr3